VLIAPRMETTDRITRLIHSPLSTLARQLVADVRELKANTPRGYHEERTLIHTASVRILGWVGRAEMSHSRPSRARLLERIDARIGELGLCVDSLTGVEGAETWCETVLQRLREIALLVASQLESTNRPLIPTAPAVSSSPTAEQTTADDSSAGTDKHAYGGTPAEAVRRHGLQMHPAQRPSKKDVHASLRSPTAVAKNPRAATSKTPATTRPTLDG
jgi:hypothetical protein